MPYFNIVAATNENTVVTEYEPVKTRSDSYQSEAALEREFIRLLTEQGYEYLPIHSEKELVANLRRKLEALNGIRFSDDEWSRFFTEKLANPNEHITEKTRKVQEDFVQVLKRDDGSTKNITLIDKKNIHNNSLQVINQYAVSTAEGARHDNRYDVTVLVNGFPMVHIELKRRGEILFGRGAACLSMCRFSSSPTVRIRSITPTAPGSMPSRMPRQASPKRKRQATALNLPHSGLMPITASYLTLLILPRLSLRGIRY